MACDVAVGNDEIVNMIDDAGDGQQERKRRRRRRGKRRSLRRILWGIRYLVLGQPQLVPSSSGCCSAEKVPGSVSSAKKASAVKGLVT